MATRPPSEMVSIGFCHHGTVRTDWMLALLRVQIWDSLYAGRFARLFDVAGPYIAESRNGIVRAFLADDKADWLLMLDNDMDFTADVIERLMDVTAEEDRLIVAALYVGHVRNGPNGQVHVAPLWTREAEDGPFRQVLDVPTEAVVELTSCGMGCTLVHRRVLEAVGRAHTGDPWPWFGHDIAEFDPEVGPVRCGEDVSFCRRARDLGFSIYGAPQVQCGHFKTERLGAEHVRIPIQLEA